MNNDPVLFPFGEVTEGRGETIHNMKNERILIAHRLNPEINQQIAEYIPLYQQ